MATESIGMMQSASAQKLDFLNLFVTELQNQNPLEPMNSQQMAAQLAQFSQLELSEKMNSNISEMNSTMSKLNASFQGSLLMAEYDYAKNLLGKEVSFNTAEYGELQGTVDELAIDPQTGASMLKVSVDDYQLWNGQRVTEKFDVNLIAVTGVSEANVVNPADLMTGYDYAKSLIGKQVSFNTEEYGSLQGTVDRLSIDPRSGASTLKVNVADYETEDGQSVTESFDVNLTALTGISNASVAGTE